MIYNLENCTTTNEEETGDDCGVIIGDEKGWDLSEREANFLLSKMKKSGCDIYRFELIANVPMDSFNLKPRRSKQEDKEVYLIDINKIPRNFTSAYETAIKLGINQHNLLQRKRNRGRKKGGHTEINRWDMKSYSEDEQSRNKAGKVLKNKKKVQNVQEIEQLLSNMKQQASTKSSDNENSGLHIHANCVAKCDFLKVVDYLISKINRKQDKRYYNKVKDKKIKPNLLEEKRTLHPKLFSLSLAQIKQLAKDFLGIDSDNDKNFQINVDTMPENIFFKVKDFVLDCAAKNIVDPNHKSFQEEIDQALKSKATQKIQNEIQQFQISSPNRLPIFECDNSISESLSDSDEDSSSSQMSLSDIGKKIHYQINEEKENNPMIEKVMKGAVDEKIDNIGNQIEMNCDDEDL